MLFSGCNLALAGLSKAVERNLSLSGREHLFP